MICENICTRLTIFYSHFFFKFIPVTDLSDALLRHFDSFWFIFLIKCYHNHIAYVNDSKNKIIRIDISILSTWLRLNTMPLSFKFWFKFTINGISRDLQILLAYFNGAANVVFLMIPFTPSASMFYNNLSLYLNDLRSLVFAMSTLELVATSLEKIHNPPVVSE